MVSQTSRTTCPKCGSDDCNLTVEELGVLIVASIRRRITFCNRCAYTKVALVVHTGEICVETRLPGEEDTELEYRYLGREKF